MCVCVCVWGGIYENCTDMYGGVPVCLPVVVVPTPRLVRILCALSKVSLRLCTILTRIFLPVFLTTLPPIWISFVSETVAVCAIMD